MSSPNSAFKSAVMPMSWPTWLYLLCFTITADISIYAISVLAHKPSYEIVDILSSASCALITLMAAYRLSHTKNSIVPVVVGLFTLGFTWSITPFRYAELRYVLMALMNAIVALDAGRLWMYPPELNKH